ncbi:hypothetical protein [Salinisphaera sp. LB1]|uniref:hypothetical protein n=1 Tax=Salinisphaera sp. LB1 TaxID=2183911 RepID=UPI000D708673|nr:hypothetical protein [Salinisphaera sp. LB1]AWN16715.1 hypothetical protein SALB1_2517 [Salinisphaera sp. LB1]
MTDAESRDETPRFGPLSDYRVPAMPTRDTLQIVLTRARELLRRHTDAPQIDNARLHSSTIDMLNAAAAPPACGPLIDELQATLGAWADRGPESPRLQLIVLPPGDHDHIVASWAERQGHHVLQTPTRDAILQAEPDALPALDGDGLLVVPALEAWFLRHRDGLWLIRALLDRLSELDRRAVIGCNSWAWQYLKRAVRVDAVLPAPLTFQPFDGERLRAWFREISSANTERPMRFRDAASGDDILALNADGKPHDRLISLAAASRGVPWIAWRLWRHSLRQHIAANDDTDNGVNAATADATNGDAHTLWVTALKGFSLPARRGDDSLLVLHALLIHGPMTPARLTDVLPFTGTANTINSLLAAGILAHDAQGCLTCTPEAYPTIRTGLTTAGFPVAEV